MARTIAALKKLGIPESAIKMVAPEVMVITYDPEKFTVEGIAIAAAEGMDAHAEDLAKYGPVALVYINHTPEEGTKTAVAEKK